MVNNHGFLTKTQHKIIKKPKKPIKTNRGTRAVMWRLGQARAAGGSEARGLNPWPRLPAPGWAKLGWVGAMAMPPSRKARF